MIGIIVAEKSETADLIKKLKAKIMEFNGIRFYIYNSNNKQAVIAFSSFGKVNAALTTMSMVTNFHVDKIFNIGVCGACKKDVKIGSMIIANGIQYFDVDLVYLNYPLNKLPDEPLLFPIKQSNIDFLKQICPDSIIGLIASGDSFVTLQNIEKFSCLSQKDILGFEMEAAAIAHVCYRTKTDFMCLKLVSDNISIDEESKKQYNSNLKNLSIKIQEICIKLLSFI